MSAARYAIQLIQQGRTDLAEPELRRALGQDPDNPELLAYLALTLSYLDRKGGGLAEAQRAVGLAPDWAFCHYVLAVAYNRLDKLKEAVAAAREAIRLDPDDDRPHVTTSAALLDLGKPEQALASAETALALNPENTSAANMRALALVKLGRKDEAAAAVEGVLSRDPESAVTHANRGWTLLHQNQPRPAMEAFREALRLEPDNDWARSGIVEAMKARNPIYRALLAYFLWMSRLSSGKRWGVIIGGYLAAQVIPGAMLIYLPLVILTWAGDSFFNLVLFLDPFGRLVLTRDERVGALLMGVCVLGGLALGIGGAVAGRGGLTVIGVGLFALSLPVGGTFSRPPNRRLVASLYTAALALVGAGAAFSMLTGLGDWAGTLGGVYVLGLVAFTWLANLFTR